MAACLSKAEREQPHPIHTAELEPQSDERVDDECFPWTSGRLASGRGLISGRLHLARPIDFGRKREPWRFTPDVAGVRQGIMEGATEAAVPCSSISSETMVGGKRSGVISVTSWHEDSTELFWVVAGTSARRKGLVEGAGECSASACPGDARPIDRSALVRGNLKSRHAVFVHDAEEDARGGCAVGIICPKKLRVVPISTLTAVVAS